MYAIVDIETTGGYAAAHGITEVAIYVFDGKRVTEKFETLINPGQPIPRYIQSFTGITDEMVAHAPEFETVAEKIFRLLNENIFIAHNVNFDYSFLRSHLSKAGHDLKSKKLCTVRLSRKIFPGFPSYGLGNLCRSLEIEINNRHRAGGDAEATVKVFGKLLENDKEGFITKSLLRNSKEQSLPPNVPKQQFEALPSTPGVYYFHDAKGKIIYIGKAINIRNRVNSHFSNNSESRQKQNFIAHIHSISFKTCATELMASILESVEIKKFWPKFNYSQKHWENVFGIYTYEDRNGYLRLAIEKNKKNLKPVHTFHNLSEGYSWLRTVIQEYNLCAKLCFLEKGNGACTGVENKSCNGACIKKESKSAYNKRVKKVIAEMKDETSYAIVDKGLAETELSCILVDNGKFFGMGYLPSEYKLATVDEVKEHLTSYRGNNYIRNLLAGHKEKFPSAIINLTAKKQSQARKEQVMILSAIFACQKKFMLRVFCLILLTFFTTVIFSQNTKTVSSQKSPVQKSTASKPIFKNLRDSASYTAGIHVVNKYRSENIYNFNSTVVARCINDIQSGKPQLISVNDADKIVLAYQDKLKADSIKTYKPAKPGTLLNDMRDSASYVAGIYIVNFFRKFEIENFNSAIIARAIDDLQNKKKPLLNDSLANMAAMRYQSQLLEIKNKSTIDAGKKFLAENKKRPTVKVTKSGLQYEVITMGTGKKPTIKDKVSCNYTGSFIDGTEFNNSYKMGGPISFDVNGVIKGWTEALQMMPVGSKWKLYVPYNLAYGPGQYQAIPGGSALLFEIDLLGIVEK